MERKIGEIFEYNCEWYQVIECSKDNYPCIGCCGCKGVGGARINGGECNGNARKDDVFVIFKKLEKIGGPYTYYCPSGRIIYFQRYKCYQKPIIEGDIIWHCVDPTLVEIKQNKEDMEEKKLNLKPFDIQKAKEGKPVCTRNGRKARIICFDRINGDYYKIVACVTDFDGDFEEVLFYGIDGYIVDSQNPKDEDLMMLPEKKEGWINIYNADTTFYYVDGRVFETKDEAVKEAKEEVEKEQREKNEYIDTIRVEWEE